MIDFDYLLGELLFILETFYDLFKIDKLSLFSL